jgi:hypothetical protein
MRELNMKFVNRITKIYVCLFAVMICLIMVSHSHADSIASVAVISSGGGNVNAIVKNISNNQPAPGGLITWSNINAGVTGWKMANQYIEISHSDLPQFWGIQMYTDNENVSANPRYTGTADPSGLVKTDNTIIALPMAWKITDSLLTGGDLSDPAQRPDNTGFSDYMWHFLKDRNTPDNPATPDYDESFQDGEDYVTLWNQSGIAWNEGGRSGNPKKAYIYLAANFTMSSVGSVYQTSVLTIEAYEGISPFPIYLYKDAPLTEYPNEPGATLENHFAPSGWMNYAGQFSVDPKCKEITPYSGTHCFKISWNGAAGADGWKWGGIKWLEPSDIWDLGGSSPTHNGYDLRGANYLSFRARTNSANIGLQLQVHFGNEWDSCGKTPSIWRTPALTTQWQRYDILVLSRDMSDVTGGLAVVFDAAHDPDPDGCVIYLDDIIFGRY